MGEDYGHAPSIYLWLNDILYAFATNTRLLFTNTQNLDQSFKLLQLKYCISSNNFHNRLLDAH